MNKQQLEKYKRVKQRLSTQQTALKKGLEEGRPLSEDIKAFVATSFEMIQLGDPAWKPEMDRYADQVKSLVEAMEADDPAQIRKSIETINECKLSCHKAFRKAH